MDEDACFGWSSKMKSFLSKSSTLELGGLIFFISITWSSLRWLLYMGATLGNNFNFGSNSEEGRP